MYYHKCEKCGANLDPGEKCDCGTGERSVLQSTKIIATYSRKVMKNPVRSKLTGQA